MNLAPLAAVLFTGFAVAFLHAALPTHWLPFVLVARARRWSGRKTLGVTALAGSGHVLFTGVLGLLLTGAGLALYPRLGALFPRAVSILLLGLGLFYLARQALGAGHVHADRSARLKGRSDLFAIAGLVGLLTISPCEAFLPIYLANVRYGWAGFLMLSGVLAVGAVGAMVTLTGLGLAGADLLRLERLERYEAAVIGLVLCGLGVAVALES